MYKALIAEDSKPILRNIRMLIQAAGLPVEVTATASNGLDALRQLQQSHADILLTDIRMPKLDGLGLIEQAKRFDPRLQTVLISGYSDFEYVRRALNLQAFDYLLKPVDQQQVTDVLRRLLLQLEEQRRSDRKLLEGAVSPEFLVDMPPDAGRIAGEHQLLLVQRRPFAGSFADRWSVERAAEALLELSGAERTIVLPALREGQFLVLAGTIRPERDLESEQPEVPGSAEVPKKLSADRVRAALEAAGLPAAVLEASEPAGLRTLSAVYGSLDRTLRERLTLGGQLVPPGAGDPESDLPPGGEASRLAVQAQLAELIAQRSKERFLLLLRQSLPSWTSDSSRLAGLERFVRLLADGFAEAGRAEAEPEEAGCGDEEIRGLFAAGSREAFAEALQDWCARRFDRLQEPSRRGGEELFGQLDRYLRQNLYAQLSITEAAQQFHVSPSYISRLVKRYTGSTFVHRYMELKIDEARRLLVSDPEVKVKHVAEALGFGDPHYFSKVFKEYTGCSPSDYKENQDQGGPTHGIVST
ncbi:response regulator transcription factor [Saccharibacillus deserti]|uniref:response regulator transcription factor n=1 Tax=Saccharibacillus deserti TaxID=1634444 RepID=UPI0015559658|nr:response regulator [Saccharibacillus deserti]